MTSAFEECYDASGSRCGVPTFPWGARLEPEGLATKRQLRKLGLSKAGLPIAAQLMRINRRTGTTRIAYLYRIADARPVRTMTPLMWRRFDAMMIARRTCPRCRVEQWYVIPTSSGICNDCVRVAEPATA